MCYGYDKKMRRYLIYLAHLTFIFFIILGLGSLYGDHELQDEDMGKQAELAIVERCLWSHFERLM